LRTTPKALVFQSINSSYFIAAGAISLLVPEATDARKNPFNNLLILEKKKYLYLKSVLEKV